MVLGVACVVLVVALAFYAMYRSKPSRLKLSANLLRLVSFSIEVESRDERVGRELPTKGDDADSKPVC